ncbi:MAG: OmpW family protein [Leptothrix sp. (in: b-proteobacteria)]
MKKSLFALAAIAALTASQFAAAQSAGTILVRARAVHLASANTNSSDLKTTLSSIVGAPAEASINDKWLPEVDFSYFFTPNIAAELILTYPQKQELSVSGAGKIGTFKHLPPTLTAQYHLTGLGALRPYVGAGVNFTNISDVQWESAVAQYNLNLKRNSYGLAAQIGADYDLGGGWLVNFDVKKVQIKTDVLSNGNKVGTLKLDPLLVGVGVGMKF